VIVIRPVIVILASTRGKGQGDDEHKEHRPEDPQGHMDVCNDNEEHRQRRGGNKHDARDWLLTDKGTEIFLSVNGKYVYPVEEGTIEWVLAVDGAKSERCEYVLFPILVGKGATVKLTITELSVSQPEVLDCPDIQKRLDEAKSGITIECHASEGSSGFSIIAKPAEMTELNARELVHQIISDVRIGPWEFEIKESTP
jgi:hypothetical protein